MCCTGLGESWRRTVPNPQSARDGKSCPGYLTTCRKARMRRRRQGLLDVLQPQGFKEWFYLRSGFSKNLFSGLMIGKGSGERCKGLQQRGGWSAEGFIRFLLPGADGWKGADWIYPPSTGTSSNKTSQEYQIALKFTMLNSLFSFSLLAFLCFLALGFWVFLSFGFWVFTS